jgi:hypothetical protein
MRPTWKTLSWACAALWLFALVAAPVWAVTPDTPEVKEVIEKGVKYLESTAATDDRLGGRCLIAMALLKNGRPTSHPKVQDALKATLAFANSPTRTTDNYSVGLALIFLCELDSSAHRSAVQAIVSHMLSRQLSNGGWSYENSPTGDTSQTQYAALGLWMADAAGVEVPQDSIERLCGWLLRTQDVSGAWGYQGRDPGNMTRVNQTEVRPSLAAAGLGSVYICSDLLSVTNFQKDKAQEGLPPALLEVKEKGRQGGRGRVALKTIDPEHVRGSVADGNRWFEQNFTVKPEMWRFYYLYGLERYMSFRELAQGRADPEPEWYNQVFAYLRGIQLVNGSFSSPTGETSDSISTAFAVLCLSRSAQKIVSKKLRALGDGVLLGGMGLPKNVSDLQERNGKVVETPLGGSVEEILAIIEDPNNPELSRLAETGQTIPLDGDVTKRSGQVARLRSLVSAGSFESRLVAVKTLGKVRDLDNVPVLLYALTDPDVRIVRQADTALRFISRKFQGVGLPLTPEPGDIKAAQQAWKDWYVAIRPDAELLE